MPRSIRKLSPTNIYHVMLRGVNQQQIFYDDDDYQNFIHILKFYKDLSEYMIYAYCLMGNHIHLLMKEGTETISHIFQRIGPAFAYWYNTKYDRTGHIFQDRFKSEIVDTERYLITVLRYILLNPVKAGLCNLPQDYPYSSAREYILGLYGITDTTYIHSLIDSEHLVSFIMQPNDDSCMEMTSPVRRGVTDAAAKKMILKEFGTPTPLLNSSKDRIVFSQSVKKLFHSGVSIRQMSRITGISRGVLQRMT